MTTVRIGDWFQGPSGFGQGGYSAHRFSLAARTVLSVAIRKPIPIETDLEVVQRGAEWQLLDPADRDAPVLTGTAWTPDVGDTPTVGIADAALATARFPLHDDHPVPVCFSCGAEPDSMQVHSGPLGDGRWASDWTVPHWAIDDRGTVDEGALWAAIDCAQAWYAGLEGGRRHAVTVQIAVDVLEPLTPGTYALVAWPGDYSPDFDGRKRGACGAVFAADGTCVAKSRSFWVATA